MPRAGGEPRRPRWERRRGRGGEEFVCACVSACCPRSGQGATRKEAGNIILIRTEWWRPLEDATAEGGGTPPAGETWKLPLVAARDFGGSDRFLETTFSFQKVQRTTKFTRMLSPRVELSYDFGERDYNELRLPLAKIWEKASKTI